MPENILEWGIAVIVWMQAWGRWLVVPMNILTFTGYIEFYLLVFPALYWSVDRRFGFRLAIAVLLSVAINLLVKLVFHDPRPYWFDPQVQLWADPESTFGIPSGHAQNSVVLWGMLAAYIRKPWAWMIAALLSLLVGISRMYLGVHFPTDVLLGWILGVLVLAAFLKWEDGVAAWFSRFSPGWQIVLVLCGTVAMLLSGVFITWLVQLNWAVPVVWTQNAALQAPEKAIEPFALEALLITTAALFGAIAGGIIVNRRYRFEAGGVWLKRVARYGLGIVGAIILWLGLRWSFGSIAAEDTLFSMILDYVRYGVLGAWITLFAVIVFIRLKLADSEIQEPASSNMARFGT